MRGNPRARLDLKTGIGKIYALRDLGHIGDWIFDPLKSIRFDYRTADLLRREQPRGGSGAVRVVGIGFGHSWLLSPEEELQLAKLQAKQNT
jgi:hypothetical protein